MISPKYYILREMRLLSPIMKSVFETELCQGGKGFVNARLEN